jgi:thioredoxin reductase/bacterioferritin-associated ferredoxin
MPDVIVVGAGPGGMMAALTAASAGLEVLLVDENPAPGGQIFRRPATDAGERAPLPDYASPLSALWHGGSVSGVTLRTGITAWAIDDTNRVYIAGADGSEVLEGSAVVVAGGTYEWVPPVTGWTLPGVVTAGGAQALLKGHRVVPGRRVLLAGSGPLILQVAVQLLNAGVTVAAVLDVMPRLDRWRAGLQVLGCPAIAGEGIALLARLRQARVPLLCGWMPKRILGDDEVTGIVAAPLDSRGRFRGTGERRWDVDAVCLSYGLVPSVELVALRGCTLDYDAALGGWIPRRDGTMQTTVPGIHAVGDGAGVLGARAAVAEGRIAAAAIARRLGCLADDQAAAIIAPARRALKRLRPVRRYLGQVFRPRAELVDLIDDRAVVCRCEDVAKVAITAAITDGAHSLHEIKSACRVGMGPCQGRVCMPTISRMLARMTGRTLAEIGHPRPRPPVKPLGVDQLAPVPGAAERVLRAAFGGASAGTLKTAR